MPAFVYILMQHDGHGFKIGKTIDISARARQIGVKHFKNLGSFALRFDTERCALEAERVLHRLFGQWRCKNAEVQLGSSEFFSIVCYDRVVHFVEHNLDLLQGRFVDNVSEAFNIEERRTVDSATKEQRRIRLEAKRRDRLMKEEKRAYRYFENVTKPALELLSKSCSIKVSGSEVNFMGQVNRQLLLKTFESLFDPKSDFRLESLLAYSHSLEEDLQDDTNPFYGVIAKVSPRSPTYYLNADILNRVQSRFWNLVYEIVGFPLQEDLETMSDDILPSPQDVHGVTREDLRRSFRHDALQAWEEFTRTNRHLTLEETLAWLATWGTDVEYPPPTCHT